MISDIAELFDRVGIISVNRLPNVFLQLNDVEPILRAVQTHFHAGGVYPIEGTRRIHQWHVQRYDEVEKILSDMLPYLIRQTHRAQLALELTRLTRHEFLQPKSASDLLIRRVFAEQILLANEAADASV